MAKSSTNPELHTLPPAHTHLAHTCASGKVLSRIGGEGVLLAFRMAEVAKGCSILGTMTAGLDSVPEASRSLEPVRTQFGHG